MPHSPGKQGALTGDSDASSSSGAVNLLVGSEKTRTRLCSCAFVVLLLSLTRNVSATRCRPGSLNGPSAAGERSSRLAQPRTRLGLQLGLSEASRAPAYLPVKAQLVGPAEEAEPRSQHEWTSLGSPGEGVEAKLDVAGVEPLPQLVVHSPFLEMAVQGLVIPAEDLRVAAVELARFVVDLADAYPDVEAHACEADLQEDVSPRERRVLAVHGANGAGIGQLIVDHQAAGDVPASADRGWP